MITLVLEPQDDGTYKVAYEWKTFRFLLDSGKTFDVQAIRDDSDLRTAVLAQTKASKIEGVAQIKDMEPADLKAAPSKRPAPKTAGRMRA